MVPADDDNSGQIFNQSINKFCTITSNICIREFEIGTSEQLKFITMYEIHPSRNSWTPCQKQWRLKGLGTEIGPHPILAPNLTKTHLSVHTQRSAPTKISLARHLHLMFP